MPVEPPQNVDELDALLEELGTITRELNLAETLLNSRLRRAREEFAVRINTREKKRDELRDAIAAYAHKHRDELTAKGGKLVELRGGTLQWKKTPPKVELDEGETEASIIRRIARLGWLRRFTRRAERKLDKDALKKHPGCVARIRGLRLTQREDLHIKPARAQAEVIKQGNPLTVRGEAAETEN